MTSVAVHGATGNLGSHVARQAITRGWELAVLVRAPERLSRDIASRAKVSVADLSSASTEELSRFVAGHDALVCCAGVVTEGERFVALFDRVVSAVETVQPQARPVCWFIAGAALLDLDANGRRGVELPKVRDTYWPHRVNFERLQRTDLDWRLLCPGPMVNQPAIGIERLRISTDTLPSPLPAFARFLPSPLLLSLFVAKVPEMIVPYADAAGVMLSNTTRGGPKSRKRVGLALPVGMRGRKEQWAARPRDAA
ncbi:MAG: NAD(P)-dependent oxidoreductase [Deltaproteobacteria bacterium]